MKQRILRILGWILALTLLALLVATLPLLKGEARYAILPYKTKVKVSSSKGVESFLQPEEVLKQLPFSLKDSLLVPINTAELETLMVAKLSYIQHINAYIAPAAHRLQVEIQSRTPLLKCYTSSGQWYFIDEEGQLLEAHYGIPLYLPIVRLSSISEEVIRETLLPLGKYLQAHSEWQSFFGMIELKERGKIHLYPRVGDYIFELNGTSTLSSDLPKIKTFYRQIIPQVGANRYRLIKLSYHRQIVCTLRS